MVIKVVVGVFCAVFGAAWRRRRVLQRRRRAAAAQHGAAAAEQAKTGAEGWRL
jgi:uncharacterized membrane protein